MTDKNKIVKARLIKHRVAERKNLKKSYDESQKRLVALIDKHGIECVSIASELTVKTLKQYTQVAIAPAIKKETVDKAETILEGL